MRFKTILKKCLPTYRAAESINNKIELEEQKLSYQIESLDKSFIRLNKRVNDLDKKNEYLFFLSSRLLEETELETRKRVFLEMPKAYGRLRSIQLAENFLLQRVKMHADELNIHFFLMGGTALGAVRHKGFIPWDDDIDIGMFQNDYYRLKEKIDLEDNLISINRYFLHFGDSVVKVKFKFSDNFYIDIFTFEIISAEETQIEEYWEKSQILAKKYSELLKNRLVEMNLLQKAYLAPVYDVALEKYAENLYRDLQENTTIDSTKGAFVAESIANGYEYRNSRKYWEISDVFPILQNQVEFEGESYCMINGYNKRLIAFYGDIWQIPNSIECMHLNEFNDEIENEIKELKKMGIL